MDQDRYNVLIVDDDPAVLRLLGGVLQAAGYDVEQADDGVHALAAIDRCCPDFVITDWEMPRMDGLELCRRLRQRALTKYVFTIFVTGRSGTENLVQGLEAGADDFLTKPVQTEVLLARLHAGQRVLKLERQLNMLASTDPLTGLLSKRAFMAQLEREWRRAYRYQLPLSCVVLDADFFKRINDTYGHPAGDQVLCTIAAALREDGRASDILGRYGGEEFVALLPETDEESATLWAERVRLQIANVKFSFDEKPLGITCSFGVAQRTPYISGGSELLALADQALIAAKHSGRDCVVSYSAIDQAHLGSRRTRDAEYQQLFAATSAADVMTTFVAALNEDDTVEQAAGHFLRSRLSSAPVVGDRGELSGIVTEKDLLGLMRSPRDWTRPLRDVMKRNVVCYELNTPVITIYEFLCRVAIRQVIIVHERRPLGMINQMNLVRWFNNWFYSRKPMATQEEQLTEDRQATELAVLAAAEQLEVESGRFVESLHAGPAELVPLLISSASRVQEKLNDVLALSRHANEIGLERMACRDEPALISAGIR